MSGASVPEALRKHLLPRRSLAGTARPETAAKVERWVQKSYFEKRHKYWDKTHAELFAAGLLSARDPELAPARAAAHELLGTFTIAGLTKSSLEILAVAERMIRHISADASLAPAIVEARGLADAISVVMRAARLGTASEGGYTSGVLIVGASANDYRAPSLALRHLVCAASNEQYESARRHAEALRAKADLADRCVLAYAFPDEPWAALELAAALDDTTSRPRDVPAWSLLSATSDAAVVRRWAEKLPFQIATHALDLACALPPAEAVAIFAGVLPKLLVKPKYGPLAKTPPRAIVQALGCIDLPEVAAVLAPYASHAVLGVNVLAYFRDHPERGAALEAMASGKKLEATASRVLGKGKAKAKAPAPTAKAKDTPAVLRETPWRGGSSKKAAPAVLVLEPLGLDLARVEMVREPEAASRVVLRDMTAAEVDDWRARMASGKYVWVDHDVARSGNDWEYRRIPDRDGLAAWNENANAGTGGDMLSWTKRHGLAAIPGFLIRDWVRWLSYEGHDQILDSARSLVSPRMAPQLARVAARKKHFRKLAMAWLLEHAEIAAYGLVPDALGSAKEARADARAALLSIARLGKEAVVRKVAKKYGAEAEQAIAAMLDADPLAIGVATPKRPDFLRLGELPQVRLLSGGALDEAAFSALVEILQITDTFDPYPGLALVREACDAASLGELAVELLEQWVIGDAPGRHEWMLFATVHFPSERGTRRVAELAREWARKNGAKAERACAALAADGTDLALMHLGHIAETTRFASLRKDAAALLAEAAGARGMTEDELGDCTVPDAGLGADGTVTLSYGERAFVVGVDPSLRPSVRERTKSGLAPATTTLPRAAKTDDAALAKAARVRFDELKKDLEAIA
ncbi:MAG: Molybdate metabolism regulator, partial [Myxococcaceae bacterium]|nr:Molybdate metabolism regulator [Myxococcaceae bacterium]